MAVDTLVTAFVQRVENRCGNKMRLLLNSFELYHFSVLPSDDRTGNVPSSHGVSSPEVGKGYAFLMGEVI